MIKFSGKGTFNLAYYRKYQQVVASPWDGGVVGDLVTGYPELNLVIKVDTATGAQSIMTIQGTLMPLREDSKILEVASLVEGCISARDIEDIIAENDRLKSVIRTLETENTALRKEFAVAIRENDL